MDKFYIFGIQRTGTSFLENLISSNYEAQIANSSGTWKHMLTPPTELTAKACYIIKAPYTWIESVVFRETADLPVTAPNIMRSGSAMINDINIRELTKLYRDHYYAWKEYPALFVRYEDILTKPKQIVYTSQLGFKRKTKDWYTTKPGSLFMSEGYTDDRIPYYQTQEPKHISNTVVEVINEVLGDEFFDLTGYKKL